MWLISSGSYHGIALKIDGTCGRGDMDCSATGLGTTNNRNVPHSALIAAPRGSPAAAPLPTSARDGPVGRPGWQHFVGRRGTTTQRKAPRCRRLKRRRGRRRTQHGLALRATAVWAWGANSTQTWRRHHHRRLAPVRCSSTSFVRCGRRAQPGVSNDAPFVHGARYRGQLGWATPRSHSPQASPLATCRRGPDATSLLDERGRTTLGVVSTTPPLGDGTTHTELARATAGLTGIVAPRAGVADHLLPATRRRGSRCDAAVHPATAHGHQHRVRPCDGVATPRRIRQRLDLRVSRRRHYHAVGQSSLRRGVQRSFSDRFLVRLTQTCQVQA